MKSERSDDSKTLGDSGRRRFLRRSGAGVLALSGARFPEILVRRNDELRVLGTHVTLQEELRVRAEKELGFKIRMEPGGSAEVLHRASTRPESFDLYEQWSNSIRVLWQANAIQPIETKRIRAWDQINDLSKTGRITPDARIGAGDSPHRILWVQKDGTLAKAPSLRVTFLPYVHNVDSFGYDAAEIPRGTPYESESWGWLLDEKHHGKAALVNAPTIGIFDAALAAQARGLMSFRDIGAMTRKEIDELFKILIEKKEAGFFRGFWSSVPDSIALMKRKEVRIASMFSPAVSALRGQGVKCVYAAPKEGYRAWHGVMCLSAKTTGRTRDLAYEYMNWWLSGWPGAFIARQGYYISNPQVSQPELKKSEWDYWYGGKPAAEDLRGTDGRISVRRGELRNGGSYEKRFRNVAVWNTVMNTFEYSLLRWNDLLSS